jgi:hypothetical protein
MGDKMSIDGYLVRITPQELTELKLNPELVNKFLGYEGEENSVCAKDLSNLGLTCNLGKQWQMIHYILTGEVAEPGHSLLLAPLCNIILGGTEIDEDALVRYLTPNEVKEVVEFLKKHPTCWVKEKFLKIKSDPKPISLYAPPTECWDEVDLSLLLINYESLYSLYLEAAKTGDGMLIWIG